LFQNRFIIYDFRFSIFTLIKFIFYPPIIYKLIYERRTTHIRILYGRRCRERRTNTHTLIKLSKIYSTSMIEKGNLISFLFVRLSNKKKMLKERISEKEKILSFISFCNLSIQKHYSLVFIHVFTLN